MGRRQTVTKIVATEVLTKSRRRCCLCVFLLAREDVRRGQIAHLDGNRTNSAPDNLVWLCLEHHDEFDTRTSQSKGLTVAEVRHWRSLLDRRFEEELDSTDSKPVARRRFESLSGAAAPSGPTVSTSWRYPLWPVANLPDLFAFKARNGADGICFIERIDLPDGRVVIVCIETAGNPGNGITNSVEYICAQVCERFEIRADRLVWLEHYDGDLAEEWNLVKFETAPPNGEFACPRWIQMTPEE